MGRAPCCDKANVKKGPWSPEEDAKLKSYIEEHGTGGNWIALPQKIGLKRCGKSCRLRWLNYLRPNIKHGGFSEEEDKIICSLFISIGSRWSIIAAQLPGRTDNDIKNYWNTRLKKKLLGSKPRKNQSGGRRGSGGGNGGRVVNKQEVKKSIDYCGSFDCNSSNINHTKPYLPQFPTIPPMPIPYSNQQDQAINDATTSFNDHTSIRKLLIKLGGRFYNDFNYHDGNYQSILNNNESSSGLNQNPPIATESCSSLLPHHPNSSSSISHEQISVSDGVLFSSSTPTENSLDNHTTSNAVSHHQFQQTQDYNLEECNNLLMLQEQGHNCTSSVPSQVDEIMNSCPPRLDGLEFLLADEFIENRFGWGEAGSLVYPFTSSCGSAQQGLI